MSPSFNDFTDQHVPPQASDEIPQDNWVRKIAEDFSQECQNQMVSGGPQTGRTTLLAQFARYHKGSCISYFISESPFSQQQHTFLFALCYQICLIQDKKPPQENIRLEELKNLFPILAIGLADHAKRQRQRFFYVIDGLEHAMDGSEGDRIIDLLPLNTAPRSPYLLCSCRSDQIGGLPERMRRQIVEAKNFSQLETATFLQDVGFTAAEIERVVQKYHGIPGYLRSAKEAKRSNPHFDVESAPADLSALVTHQIQLGLASASDATIQALELLSVSPAPLPVEMLAELTNTDRAILRPALDQTTLVKLEHGHVSRVEFVSELVHELVRQHVGDRNQSLTQRLLAFTRDHYPNNDLLLSLLYRQAQDYDGLRQNLDGKAILATVEATRDMSGVLRQLRLAAEMAKEKHQTGDLVQWTLGLAATRAFLSPAASSREIEALLAIGETDEALRKAYAVPEVSVKVRLLARAYASIQGRGDHVSRSALDELAAMVDAISLQDADQEVVREIAVDLMPVLADTAFALLEKADGAREKQSILEVAIKAIESDSRDNQSTFANSEAKPEVRLGGITRLLSSWLNDMPFTKLVEYLKSVHKTKAREYILRQWCRQNPQDPNLVPAIEMWIDTVLGDRTHTIILTRTSRNQTGAS